MEFTQDFVARLCQKEKKAFELFYQETADAFYRYLQGRYFLSTSEIEDLLSDFYVKFRRVIDQYESAYKFEAFMWTVFKNLVKDYFKKAHHNSSFVSEIEYMEESEPDELLSRVQGNFQLAAIKEAMGELDDLSYQIVIMRFVEGYTYEEICAVCDLTPDAVRKRLSRALQKIKDILSA